jgi:membrane-associated phospholipid phosphatase
MIIRLAFCAALSISPVSWAAERSSSETLGEFVDDTGRILTRPIDPERSDAWILIPAAAATALLLQFDLPVRQALRSLPDPPLFGRPLSHWASIPGDGLVDFGLFAVLGAIGSGKLRRVCIEGLEALAAVAIASRVLKIAFRLERPSFDATRKHFFSRRWKADAFPSGHTMSVFATAGVIAIEYPYLAPFVFAIATIVAIARVQQNTHWASDVVVGAALGLLFAREATGSRRRVRLAPFITDGGGGVAITGRLF